MRELTPGAVAALLADGSQPQLLDVREAWEVATAALAGASHIPMADVPARIGELDPARTVIVLCHHGGRSARVALFLERMGFRDVINVAGGIDAWAREQDPSVPRY